MLLPSQENILVGSSFRILTFSYFFFQLLYTLYQYLKHYMHKLASDIAKMFVAGSEDVKAWANNFISP